MHDMVILTVSQSYECVLNSYALNTFGKSASNWYIPPPPPPRPHLLPLSFPPPPPPPARRTQYDSKQEKRQVWYSHGAVGEPVFVPRLGLRSCTEGALVQLYVPETHTTEFVVLDAQRVDAGPLARIKLRHHIPYGFHGTFTPEVFVDSSHVIRAKL